MSTSTTNYNLVKPALTDTADITAMNPNWDTIDTKLKELNDSIEGKVIDVEHGGTGGTTQSAAFTNVVSPGGVMTNSLTFPTGSMLRAKYSDGTNGNLISRSDANNIWIGDNTGEDNYEKQSNVYIALGSSGKLLAKNVDSDSARRVLDYSFVFEKLYSGSFSTGTITATRISKYHVFMIYFSGDNTPLIALRNGNDIRGIGGYGAASGNPWTNTVGLTLSGDSVTYVNGIQYYVTANSKAIGSVTAGKAISAIYGLLGLEANV